MGYTILGMIIESATGQQYENYLDENLLKPLEMEESSFKFISQIGKDANENLAMGHFGKWEYRCFSFNLFKTSWTDLPPQPTIWHCF